MIPTGTYILKVKPADGRDVGIPTETPINASDLVPAICADGERAAMALVPMTTQDQKGLIARAADGELVGLTYEQEECDYSCGEGGDARPDETRTKWLNLRRVDPWDDATPFDGCWEMIADTEAAHCTWFVDSTVDPAFPPGCKAVLEYHTGAWHFEIQMADPRADEVFSVLDPCIVANLCFENSYSRAFIFGDCNAITYDCDPLACDVYTAGNTCLLPNSVRITLRALPHCGFNGVYTLVYWASDATTVTWRILHTDEGGEILLTLTYTHPAGTWELVISGHTAEGEPCHPFSFVQKWMLDLPFCYTWYKEGAYLLPMDKENATDIGIALLSPFPVECVTPVTGDDYCCEETIAVPDSIDFTLQQSSACHGPGYGDFDCTVTLTKKSHIHPFDDCETELVYESVECVCPWEEIETGIWLHLIRVSFSYGVCGWQKPTFVVGRRFWFYAQDPCEGPDDVRWTGFEVGDIGLELDCFSCGCSPADVFNCSASGVDGDCVQAVLLEPNW